MAGRDVRPRFKVPPGTQEFQSNISGLYSCRIPPVTAENFFRPCGTWLVGSARRASHEWLRYFQGRRQPRRSSRDEDHALLRYPFPLILRCDVRLRPAIPKAIHYLGSEEAEELVQDSIATAAKIFRNAELARKEGSAGNFASCPIYPNTHG